MKFSVDCRSGPARIGELLIKNNKVKTPNILFLDTDRFKAPSFADILLTNKVHKEKPSLQISKQFIYPKDLSKELHLLNIKQKNDYYIIPGNKDIIDETLKNNSSNLFVVGNAFQLFQQSKNFVDFIVELREKSGYQKLIYLPSIGDPTNFALLTYMGVDLFDSVSAVTAARNGTLLFTDGIYKATEIIELPCDCPSCSKYTGNPSNMKFLDILHHNYYSINNEMKKVRNAIAQDNLRGLVESRINADPNLKSIFRNLDAKNYDFLEKRTAVVNKSKVLAISKESLSRPEIKRFQNRVIERYKKPELAKILLLLPCSAKKPYSFSKSHKFFREKLLSCENPFVVHELIITSPMGLVPRELELVHPASMYDIPVTGVWDEDEKKMIRQLLKQYLKQNNYDKIVSHLPKEIMDFVEDLLKKPEKTCIDKPTSDKSLEKLSSVLKKVVKEYNHVKSQDRLKEDVQGLASYQFGLKTAEQLLKDCQIKGKYPFQKIVKDNTQLGMITKERGLISLTLDGAEIINKSKTYWVDIFDDFTLKGSVFAPGVKDADKEIRIGDEVAVLKNKKLVAVGVAQMNGEEMKESTYGEAVKVRHKI